MSFYPFENWIGFGAADFIALGLTCFLIAAALWNRKWFAQFAERTRASMIALAAAPVVLRFLLLPHHPAPVPDIYDEFSHLLVADTLRHFRLANPMHPMHRFFETFFVLQEPTYSSIYPLGQGLMLAIGWTILGHPWFGVVAATAAFCSLTYWMLRAWTTPGWSLVGGAIAVMTFGPLNPWMNIYWGGSFAAAAGCLVIGSLPRKNFRLLGLGLACVVLIRPYEFIFLFASVVLYWACGAGKPAAPPDQRKTARKTAGSPAWLPVPILLAVAGLVILFQNRAVTHEWTTLPYSLSQQQYGVPASLTIQRDPVPHRQLTPQQEMEYKSQLAFKGGEPESIKTFLLRLEYRVRFYQFFILPPLLVALIFFVLTLRERRNLWIAATLILFALGINLFPAFQFHYLAPVAPLFILMSVIGLARMPEAAARALIALCVAHFAFWYTMHLFDDREFSKSARVYETWSGINHTNPERRIAVNRQLEQIQGKLLVFVRYSPQHVFQDEWVYNEADIDHARIVWARDLGEEENAKLRAYYPDRQVLLLEPDDRPPSLEEYR